MDEVEKNPIFYYFRQQTVSILNTSAIDIHDINEIWSNWDFLNQNW